MSDIILHHYPQSPVAEKVRMVLRIKGIEWTEVIAPRVPPKPQLFKLTGGYRRIPVLQIGADIFCDSRCIITELEARFPKPSVVSNGSDGIVWAVSQWTDGPLFETVLRIVFAATADDMPDEFSRDRGALYFGDANAVFGLKEELSENVTQLRGNLGWIEARLETGKEFLFAETPGVHDALCYYLMWLLKERWPEFGAFIQEFPRTSAWQARMEAIPGNATAEMTIDEALDIARNAQPKSAPEDVAKNPLGLSRGDRISIVHKGTGEDPAVEGTLMRFDSDRVSLRRDDKDLGELTSHFPVVGYDIARI